MRSFTYHCDSCHWEKKKVFRHDTTVPNKIACGHCGKKAQQLYRPPGTPALKGWPIYSESVGVMPDQIPEARRADTVNGVPCQFTQDGRRIFNDRAHMRDWMRANGMHNRDGGYGDG